MSNLSTGIEGLDEILPGGLIPANSYLLRGGPGSGKTTLSLQFLEAGLDQNGTSLFITLDEPADQIRANGQSFGIATDAMDFLDLSPSEEKFTNHEDYDVFASEEVELSPLTQAMIEKIEGSNPDRIALDALTHLRYLSPDVYQFREQILSFLQFLRARDITPLLLSEVDPAKSPVDSDDDLQYMVDGVLTLHRGDNRTLTVNKFRGSDFDEGAHHVRIKESGIEVYPRLSPEEQSSHTEFRTIPTGIPQLNQLLGGGLEMGTVTLLTGPSGVGKTTLGAQFLKEAAAQNLQSVLYSFEESEASIQNRAESLNIPLKSTQDAGSLSIVAREPLNMTSMEFAQDVRSRVDAGADVIMIDSLTGFNFCFDTEDDITTIRSIAQYIKNQGATLLLIDEMKEIAGENFKISDQKISHLADSIVFLRYLEIQGELRRVIGVIKKRQSDFEKQLREFRLTEHGIKIGEPLEDLRGIITGTPELVSPESENGRGDVGSLAERE